MRIRWRGFELPTRVVLEKESATDKYGKFVAEPFERGYGVTIGNSLRRVLLSSLEGAAVTAIRIETSARGEGGKPKTVAVRHEFTALAGVYEDVSDIVLNVKELRFKVHCDEPVTLTLGRTGKGEVTGADIGKDQRVELVNPEAKLCTLVDDIAFNMELVVRKGRGYRTAEENIEEGMPEGTIPVDSIYSPVRRVRYRAENARVGQRTDYDKLILEIWTDGTKTPEMAMVEASTILRKHYNPFVKYFELGAAPEVEGMERAAIETGEDVQIRELREKLALPVSVLDPSVRAENCLAAEKIQTLGDLVRRTEADMLRVKNFGKTSLKEIRKKLADMGLSFGMQIPEEVLKKQ
ncbi:MAG: DNA-directed RNA polymerase subunit alpha [Planctomycetota bacterium]|nr:DNA-directed RNA polymerase subunit alpha [Planctomycetota bacterium]